MIAVLNYRAGNLTSVKRALDHENIPSAITDDAESLAQARGIIFPGVGAAGSAMHNLRNSGLDKILKELLARGKPMLGICLGCQIILDKSMENHASTLSILPGSCERFQDELQDEHGDPINIPHMGWNNVNLVKQCELFQDVPREAEFYFVHSYFPVPHKDLVIGDTHYGREFCSVFGRPGLWAMQFHPEKSGRPGLKILNNFYKYCMNA
ncbi:imidazole glycerol phosphate synthase subunit HisH [Desulfonatronospira sp.]|uniref:imidazole glycerol phosphate synthase subunit HisH n=1 Tax=Desulfonatronospira sp. TaxID=1962951 RepID=UPI0025BD2F52|nr:imidazole glycerol phosphate synthase subunit HisH [Desulfonatronospira sp.]